MIVKFTLRTWIVAVTTLGLLSCTIHPNPTTHAERAERIANDKKAMFGCQEPIRGQITLAEAMARSLKYNLDLRLKKADTALARSDYDVSRYEMLPDVVASAGYLTRSNEYAVFSSRTGGVVSFSQDRHRRIADLQASWHLLDFGVSYIEARQKGNAYLISRERCRKMEQNIIRDVRYAYWRAVSAQKLMRSIKPLIAEVKSAITKSHRLEKKHVQKPTEALQYQKRLLSTLRDLTTLERELTNAKRELAALMNIPTTQKFSLVEPRQADRALPKKFPMNMRMLEYIALQHRPEVREEDYRTRMSVEEVYKAKLRMLPGLELTGGENYDSNGFLVNSNWANYGAMLTWNLVKLFAAPANIRRAQRETGVANIRRMALSMAVMTQVDISYLRYLQMRKELKVIKEERDVNQRLYRQMKTSVAADKTSELELIQVKTDKILAQLRYDLTYAEWQNSAGQLMNSVGYDLLPIFNLRKPVNALARSIQAALYKNPHYLLNADNLDFPGTKSPAQLHRAQDRGKSNLALPEPRKSTYRKHKRYSARKVQQRRLANARIPHISSTNSKYTHTIYLPSENWH